MRQSPGTSELRHRLLCYSQPTWPPFHWKCGFKSLLTQHLQPSESFFRSCESPTRNNNLFTTIGPRKKPKGLLSPPIMRAMDMRWPANRSFSLPGLSFGRFFFVPWVLLCSMGSSLLPPRKRAFFLSGTLISYHFCFESFREEMRWPAPNRSLSLLGRRE